MWRVELLKAGPGHDFPAGYFPAGYFPRKAYYKKDALRLKAIVESKGGEASIWKEKR